LPFLDEVATNITVSHFSEDEFILKSGSFKEPALYFLEDGRIEFKLSLSKSSKHIRSCVEGCEFG